MAAIRVGLSLNDWKIKMDNDFESEVEKDVADKLLEEAWTAAQIEISDFAEARLEIKRGIT